MWYENLYSHYKVELTWSGASGDELELIITKGGSRVDLNNVLYADTDGKLWLDIEKEGSSKPSGYIAGKILWCLNCDISIHIKPLYFDNSASGIAVAVYKGEALIESFPIDEALFCSTATVPVCKLHMPTNIYDMPIFEKL